MKCQLFSDIHLESVGTNFSKLWNAVTPQAPVAIVAGDIHSSYFEGACNEIASKFEKVFCVMGNHEWYKRDISWKPDPKLLAPNVTVLDCSSEEYQGVLFVGCTLWTDFKNTDWFVLRSSDDGINDFHIITDNNGETRFTARAALEKHHQERNWLKKIIELNRDKQICVVTHFMPSYECVHDKWKKPGTEILNRYFSAGCDDIIECLDQSEFNKVWCFGHTHDHRDLKIGYYDVRMVCNPLGYGLGSERARQGDPYTDMIIEV